MMPEKRPHVLADAAAQGALDFGLLGDLQCVVDIEVPNGTFQLGVTNQ